MALGRREKGFSIIELMVAIGLMGVMMAYALPNLGVLNDPMQNGLGQVSGFIKQARARAMSTTSAYTVRPDSNQRLIAEYANSCNDPSPVADSNLTLELPKGVQLPDTTWEVCFNGRGLADSSAWVYLQGPNYESRWVEVYAGGLVRIGDAS